MWVQPGNRIRFVRACVRASEAACAREAMLLPWLNDFREKVLLGRVAPARACPPPWPSIAVVRACDQIVFSDANACGFFVIRIISC